MFYCILLQYDHFLQHSPILQVLNYMNKCHNRANKGKREDKASTFLSLMQ